MNTKLQVAGVLFDFLRSDPSFEVVSETESGGFDNACDVWKSLGVLVRFVCDRGQISVEISSALTDKWHDLGLVRMMVERGDATERPNLDELAAFFRANQAQLAWLFATDEIITTEEKLAELRQQRARDSTWFFS